jgi:hypothetical protein
MEWSNPCTAAVFALAFIILAIIVLLAAGRGKGRKSSFWTQYGGAIPADEQVRLVDAEGLGEKGVENEAWMEAYWPPLYCSADVQSAAEGFPPPRGEAWRARPPRPEHRRHYQQPADPPPGAVRDRRLRQPEWNWCPCPGQPQLTCRCLPGWWW